MTSSLTSYRPKETLRKNDENVLKIDITLYSTSGVGKLFTRRAASEKILKSRAARIGRAKKRKGRPQISNLSIFYLKSSVEQKKVFTSA